MAKCCTCSAPPSNAGSSSLPLICMVPRDGPMRARQPGSGRVQAPRATAESNFTLLDEDYIKKNFDLPQRPLYLDPIRRPLITFPMTQEDSTNFNLDRKYKINQQILDGTLDQSEAITAPSVFPYGNNKSDATKRKEAEENEEIIYILQLPDLETRCPMHNQIIRTPRFIWHSCKKKTDKTQAGPKRGGGVLNKPKPWLLSRHTDFDMLSQW